MSVKTIYRNKKEKHTYFTIDLFKIDITVSNNLIALIKIHFLNVFLFFIINYITHFLMFLIFVLF